MVETTISGQELPFDVLNTDVIVERTAIANQRAMELPISEQEKNAGVTDVEMKRARELIEQLSDDALDTKKSISDMSPLNQKIYKELGTVDVADVKAVLDRLPDWPDAHKQAVSHIHEIAKIEYDNDKEVNGFLINVGFDDQGKLTPDSVECLREIVKIRYGTGRGIRELVQSLSHSQEQKAQIEREFQLYMEAYKTLQEVRGILIGDALVFTEEGAVDVNDSLTHQTLLLLTKFSDESISAAYSGEDNKLQPILRAVQALRLEISERITVFK